MVTKKKRKVIIITIIILVILIIIGTLVALYLTTDMFKSNKILFSKYFGENVELVQNIQNVFQKSAYDQTLEENKFTNDTEIKVNYTAELGTSSENTDNVINDLALKLNGQVDKVNNYNYQKINLMHNEESAFSVEYIRNNQNFGIRFSDLFKEFTTTENSNLKELASKIENVNIDYVPEQIDFDINIQELLSFSEAERETLSQRYLNIIDENTIDENFSKKSNITVKVNGENTSANAYILTLTKEQLNNLFLKMLEQLKQDDIILNKIEKIQEKIENYVKTNINFKDEFIKKVEEQIQKINETNMGNEETQIIVYENERQMIKTVIQTTENTIEVEKINDTNMMIKYTEKSSEKDLILEISKGQNDLDIILRKEESGKATQILQINSTESIESSKSKKTSTIKYENPSNRMEIKINNNIEKVQEFENPIILNEENNINLNTLQTAQLQRLANTITSRVNEEIQKLTTEINFLEIQDMLYEIGIINKKPEIEFQEITQTEIDRFNAQFEFFKNQKIKASEITSIIDSLKNNIVNVEINSEKQAKIEVEISNNNINQEEITKIVKFLDENKDKEYNVTVEYDENNGVAKFINIIEEE